MFHALRVEDESRRLEWGRFAALCKAMEATAAANEDEEKKHSPSAFSFLWNSNTELYVLLL